jgi:streptogramin lyase
MVDWGDGHTSAGTIVSDGSGGFNVVGAHAYAEEGSYNVGVTITDAGSSSVNVVSSTIIINEFTLPTNFSVPFGITAGPDGNLWFTELNGAKIATINPTTHVITEFAMPSTSSEPAGIAVGPDGKLWFTDPGTNQIGVIDPTSHAVSEFAIPTPNSRPTGITSGAGGIWFTEQLGNKIGVIDPTSHVISEFAVPTASSQPVGITAAAGGVWFTEAIGNKIGVIDPNSHAVSEFTVPTVFCEPLYITAGPDGQLWFTEYRLGQIGAIDPNSHAISEFALSEARPPLPYGITTGPDGRLWFAENNTAKIGVIDPTSHVISDVASLADGSSPEIIVTGSDGNLWFTEQQGRIGLVNVRGNPATVVDAALNASSVTISAVEGAGFTGTVATFTDPGGAESLADYSARIDWGDGSSSDGSISYDQVHNRFSISGPTSRAYSEEGSFLVTVTIHHDSAPDAMVTDVATVADAALTASGVNVSAVEGTAFSGTVATFTDANPNPDINDFSAAITWDDGNTSAGIITANADGTFSVNGSNTYGEEGSFAVSVTIADAGGTTASTTSMAIVSDPAVSATGGFQFTTTEGSGVSGTFATFTDPGNPIGSIAGTVTDNSSPPNALGNVEVVVTNASGQVESDVFTPSDGTYRVLQLQQGTHAMRFALANYQTVIANVSVAGNTTTIQNVVMTPLAPAPRATLDVTVVDETGTPVASASVSVVDLLNGTQVGPLETDGNGFSMFTNLPTDPVTVTASQIVNGILVRQGSASATLVAGNNPFVLTIGPVIHSGPITTPNALTADAPTYTATIDWGDGTQSAGTIVFDPNTSSYRVDGNHNYAEDGTYTVTTTINHEGILSTTTSTVTVTDAALSASGVDVSAVEGSAFSGRVAHFTDANPNPDINDFSATIDWSDGHTSAGTITADGSGGFNVSGSNTYAEEGSYAVSVSIMDAGGSTASASSTATVADASLSATGVGNHSIVGVPVTAVVATFTDANSSPNINDFSATIDWGDGTTSAGTITSNGSGGFNVTGSHTYATADSYLTSVTITDAGGSTASASSTQTVNKDNTTTSLTLSPNPSVFGQLVTFTATVSAVDAGAGTPSGMVVFSTLDGSIIGTATLSGGTASIRVARSCSSNLSTCIAKASYEGDSNFNTSTSNSVTQTVNPADTTSTVSALVNPSVFGQVVTFTATVTVNTPGSDALADPTGTVTFYDAGVSIGTGTLSGTSPDTATFTISALSTGMHTITAAYTSGDANFNPSPASSAITQTVNMADTTTTLASSPNPSVFGQSVTFTATVSPVEPGSGTPTGMVLFTSLDGTNFGSAPLVDGIARFVYVRNNPATLTDRTGMRAIYQGDGNFNSGTSNTVTQTVNAADTTTTLTSSPNPSVFGQSVTFTATVSPVEPGGGTPTGMVLFTSLDGTNFGSAPLVDGIARFVYVRNNPATLTDRTGMRAIYQGDGNFNSGTSNTVTQTVNAADTTTTLVSSLNPSNFGQSVTFTATVAPVAPGAGTPTGTVTFLDGAATLGTASLSLGSATFTTSSLSAGLHAIAVSYAGDANFNSSTSSVVTQTVNQTVVNTTTSVTSSLNPAVFGQTVAFTATVAPTSGSNTPVGSVTFKDGATTLGTANLSSGSATFSTSSLAVGNHTITVVFAGSTNFNSSASSAITATITKATSTTTATSSVNPSQLGQTVTFTATITPQFSGTATGTVTFLDGKNTLGTRTLSGGSATLSTTSLALGNHTITVSYAGDANFNSSVSAALTQTVTKGSTTTTVTSSANPSVFGQLVTFTATVSPVISSSGTPTGTVTFLDGKTVLGTGTLSGGSATISISSLTIGNHTITVTYPGDTNFVSSTSSAITQTVTKASSSTAVVSSANPSTSGQAVTFTATVSAVAPGSGTPTGSITFLDGATTLATAPLSSGSASFTTSTLNLGMHTITVRYSGDANFNSSTSAALTQTVNSTAVGTTTTVTSSTNPSVFGQAVTFTATVTPNSGSATPTGTVTFLDGAATLGTASLSSGSATFTTSILSVGTHTITVAYSPSGGFISSTSPAITQTVTQAASSISVLSSLNPSGFAQAVTFTATVSAVAPGAGTPTGTVTFLDGAATLGTAILSLGTATVTTSTLSVGNHTITVIYAGDANFNSSTSAALTQTVNAKTDTTTTISSSANPSVFSQAVTFTATVGPTSGSGTPTGTVTFLDGTATLGTGALSSGSATFSTSILAIGSQSITARYGGNASFNSSVSPVLVQTVTQDGTTTTLTSSQNPSGGGQAVTFTAAVAANAPGSGTPTGTVTFFTAKTTLGTATLDGTGHATLLVANPGSSTVTVFATYNGDGNFTTSTGSEVQTISGKPSTNTSLVSSSNPSVFNAAVTFTATVTSSKGNGTPNNGTVTFYDGKTSIGSSSLDSNGMATFTISTLSIGTHSITAVYQGNANFLSSTSPTLTQTVTASTALTVLSHPALAGNIQTASARSLGLVPALLPQGGQGLSIPATIYGATNQPAHIFIVGTKTLARVSKLAISPRAEKQIRDAAFQTLQPSARPDRDWALAFAGFARDVWKRAVEAVLRGPAAQE